VPDEVTLATFRRLLAGNDGMVGLVAEDSVRLVALAYLVFHPSTWSTTVYCYLEDMFVAPTARGPSVALDLIRAVFAEAALKDATSTYWHTQEFNGPARSLCDQVAHPNVPRRLPALDVGGQRESPRHGSVEGGFVVVIHGP